MSDFRAGGFGHSTQTEFVVVVVVVVESVAVVATSLRSSSQASPILKSHIFSAGRVFFFVKTESDQDRNHFRLQVTPTRVQTKFLLARKRRHRHPGKDRFKSPRQELLNRATRHAIGRPRIYRSRYHQQCGSGH